MLGLQSRTTPDWVKTAEEHLDQILIDHAHCEKKAAGTAVNLIFSYVERVDFVRPLASIAQEELEHFQRVVDLLEQRGISLVRQTPSSYGKRLADLVRSQEPARAVDRCLVGALIEARSCERFAALRDHLSDQQLSEFYGDLFASEARHYTTYINFACQFDDEVTVKRRFEELAEVEASILAKGDPFPRLHS